MFCTVMERLEAPNARAKRKKPWPIRGCEYVGSDQRAPESTASAPRNGSQGPTTKVILP
jgi:hypothetical protein